MKLHKRFLNNHAIPWNRENLIFISALLIAPLSNAQQEDAEEELFDLSPFVVSTDETGWDATETLAGSRLRTKLDDVASQVEVLTLDFMDDFGLNSVEEAAIYSLNVENNGEWVPTGFTNDTGRQALSPEQGSTGSSNLRVRGLSRATRGRNFFATYFAPDNYNVSRVTISSGPNAILFGTGSPGGIVNTTLARALFNDTYSAKVQFDDWGSERYQFMANRNIIDDVLAVRIATLYEDRHFYIRPSDEQSRRLYGTLRYKPFERTDISFHLENIKVESRRPSRKPAFDEVSLWATAGDLAADGWLSDVYGNKHIFENGTEWIEDGSPVEDSTLFGTWGKNPVMLIGSIPDGVPVVASYENTVRARGLPNVGSANDPYLDPVNTPPIGISLTDDTYYPIDVNWLYNLESQLAHEDIYNIFINQQILENLNLELAWQREEYDEHESNMMADSGGVSLQVDANQYLPDGVTPNPYAGDFYFQGNPSFYLRDRERDEYRASLAYDFDFKEHFENKILRNLGRHRLGALYNERKSESIKQRYRYVFVPKFDEAAGQYYDAYIPNFRYEIPGRQLLGEVVHPSKGNSTLNVSANQTDRGPGFRTYVTRGGDAIIPDPGFDMRRDPALHYTDANGEVWLLDPENAALGTNGERLVTGEDADGIKDKITTKQFAYNGYFFGDRLVYTFGWREDEIRSGQQKTPEVMYLNRENGEETTSSGFVPHRSLYGYEYGTPNEDRDSGITRYHGVVLHPFRGWDWNLPLGADFSLLYSKSGTFQANSVYVNADGHTVPGEEGDGRDIGFRLSLFNNRFSMRYNDYKVTAEPAIGAFDRIRGAIRPEVRNMLYGFGARDPNGDGTPAYQDYDEFVTMFPDWPLLNDPTADPRRIYPFDAGGNFETGDFGNEIENYQTLSSSVSKGKEITVRVSPTNSLDIRFTYTNKQVIDSDVAGRWIQWIDEFIDMMDNSPSTLFVEGYNPADNESEFLDPNGYDMDGLDIDPNDGLPAGVDYFRWDQISNGGGANSRNLTSSNQPWGQNDDNMNPATPDTAGVVVTNPDRVYTDDGWTRDTMRERFISRAVNGERGTTVIRALDGRPNDFAREKRFNLNAMYRIREGRLKGTSIGLAYRWRDAAVVALQAVPNVGTDGIQTGYRPDATQLIKGDIDDAVDLTLSYSGSSKFFGGSKYTIRLIARNLFPDDDRLTPTAIDTLTERTLTVARLNGRQLVVSFELKM